MNEGQRRAFKSYQTVADALYPKWQCSACGYLFPLGNNTWNLGYSGNTSIVKFKCPHCHANGETTLINPSLKLSRLLEAWDAINNTSDFLVNSEDILNEIKGSISRIQEEYPHIDFLPSNWEELLDFYSIEAFEDTNDYMLINSNLSIPDD